MATLLDVYNSIEGQEKLASYAAPQEDSILNHVDNETLELLDKYASAADNALYQSGYEYNDDDVVKVAQLMINEDVERSEQLEKIAEIRETAIILANEFKKELGRN